MYIYHDFHQINELETELAEIKGIKDKLHRSKTLLNQSPLSFNHYKFNFSDM